MNILASILEKCNICSEVVVWGEC